MKMCVALNAEHHTFVYDRCVEYVERPQNNFYGRHSTCVDAMRCPYEID